jgi:nitrite reductase/ring-hydroxylating ferredoxin subunit
MGASFTRCRNATGWFQVGYVEDVARGEVKALKYFGKDLVLWRGESGEAYLQDAHCMHLGAHRGIGGKVNGNNLVCPWHLWEWNGEGRNTLIPYSPEGCNQKVRIRTYPLVEWCGLLMCWFDPGETAPSWQLPEVPEHSDPKWFPLKPSRSRWTIKGHIQMPIENSVDYAHIHPIHGAADYPVCKKIEQKGHWFCSTVEVVYGGDKESTYLTPNGPVTGAIEIHNYGVGIGIPTWRTLPWPTIQITCFTPIDDVHMEYFFQQMSMRGDGETGDELKGMAKAMLRTQMHVIPQDFFIWENMQYLENATFADAEGKLYPVLRRWAQQFYEDTRPEWERHQREKLAAST